MMKQSIFTFIICLITQIVFAQPKSFVDSLYSESLGKTMPLSIIVPSDYHEGKAMPVMYLLHGHSLNHDYFIKYTNILEYIEKAALLCVMPEGNNSFWINSCSSSEDRYEDYLINDISNHIEKKFNIDYENQFISGFSMGGYGAMIQALRHPDRFKFAASIAGALMYPRDKEILEKKDNYRFAVPSTNSAFGEQPNECLSEVDPFIVYKNTTIENLPYIFLFVGLQDGFHEIITTSREFADSLSTYDAFFEYHEIQGRHNSRSVDASLEMMFYRIKYLQESRSYRQLSRVLLKTVHEKGVGEAIKKYNELKITNRKNGFKFDEWELSELGYQLLKENRISDAIKIFKLNNEEFPEESITYDDLGQAFEKNNELKQAAEYYNKAYRIGIKQSSVYINDHWRALKTR